MCDTICIKSYRTCVIWGLYQALTSPPPPSGWAGAQVGTERNSHRGVPEVVRSRYLCCHSSPGLRAEIRGPSSISTQILTCCAVSDTLLWASVSSSIKQKGGGGWFLTNTLFGLNTDWPGRRDMGNLT